MKIIKKIKNSILKRKLNSCGKNFFVDKGISLIGPQFINIGDNFNAGRNLYLQAWKNYRGTPTGYVPNLTIGNNVSIMDDCQLSCMNNIIIGDNALFGNNVFITDNFHGKSTEEEMLIPPIERKLISKGYVHIGKNVWLGRNVCIMPNVTIGDGVVVGANAVVTHDVPAYSIIAGVPAKVIKQYR